jgi:hypothetical protein
MSSWATLLLWSTRVMKSSPGPAGPKAAAKVWLMVALPGSCSPWTWKSPVYQPGVVLTFGSGLPEGTCGSSDHSAAVLVRTSTA